MKQLFIGAEGTLGVVTGVALLTPAAPQASTNVILALPHFDNVLPVFTTVKRELSDIISAFEFIDRASYDLAVKHGQGRALREEQVEGAECFVLVETSGGRREHDEEVSNLSEAVIYNTDTFPETNRCLGRPPWDRSASYQHRYPLSIAFAVLVTLGSSRRSLGGHLEGGQGIQIRRFHSLGEIQGSRRLDKRASSV